MNYNRIILISIDALSNKYQYLFEDYFTTTYKNYRTTNTWTLPGHLAMLSGLELPSLFYVPKADQIKRYENFVLNIPTIATLLKKYGFKTRAITGGGYLSKFFGWGHDWDVWQEASDSQSEWRGEKIIPDKKEFLFLHTYFVHNWFEENEKMKKTFMDTIQKDESEKIFVEKAFIKKGEKAYEKRIKTIAKKLRWIKDLDKKTLVILTSDHAELFLNSVSFHHGNFSLKNRRIFMVPFLIKENLSTKSVITDFQYDFLTPKLIFDKLGLPFRSILLHLIKDIDHLKAKNVKLKEDLRESHNCLNKIKLSKFFKMWQLYNKIKNII